MKRLSAVKISNMKKISAFKNFSVRFFLAIIFISLLVCALPKYAQAAQSVTINVYNWGQYISDGTDGYIDVIEEFEKAYPNIKVNYMTYDSNETMYTKLQSGGSTYDVIIPSDYMIGKMISEDMLEELDFNNIPNYKYIDDAYKNMAYDPENKYSVPYTWGCVGVIYNKKYVNESDIGSWDLLWNQNYAGKILMFDNPRDAFAIGEHLLGYSLNSESKDEYEAVTEKLKAQKNLVQSYVMDQVFDKLEREEAWIGPYYAGDYLTMVEENPNLGFYFPEEGFNLFVDALCVPKGCAHKAEAECFINFVTDPEIMGQNLEFLGYSVPATKAKDYMDPEVIESPIAYPSEDVLARGEAFASLSKEANQDMNACWLSVKTDDNVLVKYLILTGAAIVVCFVLWLIFRIRKKRALKRRCTHME